MLNKFKPVQIKNKKWIFPFILLTGVICLNVFDDEDSKPFLYHSNYFGYNSFSVFIMHSAYADTTNSKQNSALKVDNIDTASINKKSDRQLVAEVITSEDFAKKNTTKYWKRKDKVKTKEKKDRSWFEKLLDRLFDSFDFNSYWNVKKTLQTLAVLIKALLIFALVIFILWVLNKAGYLKGWINRTVKLKKTANQYLKTNSLNLSNNAAELPIHQDISQKVAELIAQNELIAASSILYRGSLRWLNEHTGLQIIPAQTEQQCLQQIAALNNDPAQQYIADIIKMWQRLAYTSKNQFIDNNAIANQLQQLSAIWLLQLPINSHHLVKQERV